MRAAAIARTVRTRRRIVKPAALGPFNASTYATTTGKNADGSTSSTAIELGVAYNSAGIFGHKYWLAFMPYTNHDTVNELPEIAYSDDGNTWSSAGITLPLEGAPTPPDGLADASLLDNVARDGRLYCYYNHEGNTNVNVNGVYYRYTTDGTTWSSASQTVQGGTGPYDCVVVAYDPASTNYWMYTIDLIARVVYRRTATSPTGSWSAPTSCSMPLPGGHAPWHFSQPVKIGSKWVFCTSDANGAGNLWLLSSTDGLNWTGSNHILVAPGVGWDGGGLYRPAIQDAGDGLNLFLWYVTGLGGANQVSQKVAVPQSEIP